jgi:hypothetical protein
VDDESIVVIAIVILLAMLLVEMQSAVTVPMGDKLFKTIVLLCRRVPA